MVEVNGFDVHRISLIIFLFLLNHEELYWIEIRGFSHWDTFCAAYPCYA